MDNMKRLAIAALAVLALGMGSMPAAAQQFADAFGDLYITTDVAVDPWDLELGPTSICIDDPGVPAFSTLNFFLVIKLDFADIGQEGQNVSNGFGGYEAQVTIPADLTITARTKQPPSSINVGNDATDNWIVGTGIVITASTTPYAVVEYNSILLAAAQDLSLTLGPSDPSSFDVAGGPGPVPGWLEGVPTGDCVSGTGSARKCLRAFERWDQCENTFFINYTGDGGCAERCIVATKDTSWGALKSKF
jgi:hypothetical protein